MPELKGRLVCRRASFVGVERAAWFQAASRSGLNITQLGSSAGHRIALNRRPLRPQRRSVSSSRPARGLLSAARGRSTADPRITLTTRGTNSAAAARHPSPDDARRIRHLILYFGMVFVIVEGIGQTDGIIAQPLIYYFKEVHSWTPVQVTAALAGVQLPLDHQADLRDSSPISCRCWVVAKELYLILASLVTTGAYLSLRTWRRRAGYCSCCY